MSMNLWILDKEGNKINIDENSKLSKHRKIKIYGICSVCGQEFSRLYINKESLKPICGNCLKKSSYIKKYGVDNPAKSELIKNKIKQTNLNRYGVSSPFQSEKVKSKIKSTMIKKYGVPFPLQNKTIKEKAYATFLEKYGSHPLSNSAVREKIKDTNVKKYGYNTPSKNVEIINKIKSASYKKFFKRVIGRIDTIKPLFDISEYNGVKKKYKWQCLKCGTVFEDDIDNGKIPRCPTCFPIIAGSSKGEEEILLWLKELGLEVIHRYVLNKTEFDIFVPGYKLLIEFDGLYWHSEISGNKNSRFHLKKTETAKQNGFELIHIFEDEWIEKQDIVKSIILNKVGLSKKIYARKCELLELDKKTADEFLESYHLHGTAPSSIRKGLVYNKELVSVITFGKARFNKNIDYEIVRYATKNGINVIGGLSKLLKAFKYSLITYADRRYFDGHSYLQAGFKFSHFSEPAYYYTDHKHRYSRIRFQKHKLSKLLENYEPALTEWQNMQLNGWDRIWDCGNAVYVREL